MPSRHSSSAVIYLEHRYFAILGEPPPDLSVGSCFHAACNHWNNYQGPPGHTGGLVLPAAWMVRSARSASHAECTALTQQKAAHTLLGDLGNLQVLELEQTNPARCENPANYRLHYLWWASDK